MADRIDLLNKVFSLMEANGATYEDAAYVGACLAGQAVALECGDAETMCGYFHMRLI